MKFSKDHVIVILVAFVALFLANTFCSETPTPSQFDTDLANREIRKATRQNYLDCKWAIKDQVSLLEQAASACASNYDCRAKIAQQIEELGDKFEATCVPVPPDLSPDFGCEKRLIKAKASYVFGAPSRSGDEQFLAEEILGEQLMEALMSCISLNDEELERDPYP